MNACRLLRDSFPCLASAVGRPRPMWLIGLALAWVGCMSSVTSGEPDEYLYKPLAGLPLRGISDDDSVIVDPIYQPPDQEASPAETLAQEGWHYAKQGEPAEAIEALTQAMGMTAQHDRSPLASRRLARLHMRRGIVHWANEDYDAAIADYSEAIRREPNYWEHYFHRWQAYEAQGRQDLAEADRRRGLELKPKVFERQYAFDAGKIDLDP